MNSHSSFWPYLSGHEYSSHSYPHSDRSQVTNIPISSVAHITTQYEFDLHRCGYSDANTTMFNYEMTRSSDSFSFLNDELSLDERRRDSGYQTLDETIHIDHKIESTRNEHEALYRNTINFCTHDAGLDELVESYEQQLPEQIVLQGEYDPELYQEPSNEPSKSTKSIQSVRKQHQREQDKNRTRSLNVAFCRLRSCLPEIPKDTKLTKIRTLRYAISYIRHLMETVHGTQDEPGNEQATSNTFPNHPFG